MAFEVLLTKPLSGASRVGQELFDEPEYEILLASFVPKMAPMIPPHTRMSNRTAIPIRLLLHVLRCRSCGGCSLISEKQMKLFSINLMPAGRAFVCNISLPKVVSESKPSIRVELR